LRLVDFFTSQFIWIWNFPKKKNNERGWVEIGFLVFFKKKEIVMNKKHVLPSEYTLNRLQALFFYFGGGDVCLVGRRVIISD
jgi:hypothetical protein